MNARESFHAVMHFKPAVQTLRWEFGYWGETIERWHREGLKCRSCPSHSDLPKDGFIHGEAIPFPNNPGELRYRDTDVHSFFGFDKGAANIPLEWMIYPQFSEMILDEDETTYLMTNVNGVKLRKNKESTSVPQFIDWPVHDRQSWERTIKERFSLDNLLERFPANWNSATSIYGECDYPLGLGMGGFFSVPRELMGITSQLMMYYDDPALMHDMNNTFANVWLAMLEEVTSKVQLDFVHIWEDMAYKNGPLLSPRMFEEFLMPYYRRITGFLRERGIEIIFIDSDGDCQKLIPLLLEAGISGLYPFEVNAGMDIVEIRKKYPQLLIQGGLDKIAVIKGQHAIDLELETKLPYMLAQGGYIPFMDHMVPPDVSWENFKYYRERVNNYIQQFHQ